MAVTTECINRPTIVANHGFAIYFDNVRVDQFVKDYSVSLGTDSTIGNATINMIYVPEFDKVLRAGTKITKVVDSTKTINGPDATNVKKVAKVGGSKVNIRVGPDKSKAPTAWGEPGEKLSVLSKSGTWVRVSTSKGKTGWVQESEIVITEEKAETQKLTESFLKSVEAVDGLNEGISITNDDGIENMTNVRIFVKNIFSGKYVQIFGGNISGKSTSISGGEKVLTFQCQDFMTWLTRTICPIAVPFDNTLTKADRLKWSAQGISVESPQIQKVTSANEISFKGKSISEIWAQLSKQTISINKLYTTPDSVAAWDNAINRVVIMGDIDANLRKKQVVDFMLSSSQTSVNSIYVMMNDILRTLMFEFYQDRDETIRIKPPFWNEHVLSNHVIDPALILSYTETTNYESMYTRVCATGGLDEWMSNSDNNQLTEKMLTPVAVYTTSGVYADSGSSSVKQNTDMNTQEYQYEYDTGASASIGNAAAQYAKTKEGEQYGSCAEFIEECFREGGYSAWGSQSQSAASFKRQGKKVTNFNDLRPGDIIFPIMEPGEKNCGTGSHVILYIGNNKTAELWEDTLPSPVIVIKALREKKYIYEIRRITEGENEDILTEKPSNLGPASLLEPSLIERKYGPLIYDCTQPLIKFSTSTYVDSSASSYEALTKYAKFMLNYLNSSCSMASVQAVAMPWLRAGFNVWIDPIRTDKIYYINSINHYGNASGNYTTLNLTMGRRRKDFLGGGATIGSLNPGKSDNAFVSSIDKKASDVGPICNYGDVLNKMKAFYITDKTDSIQEYWNSSYFKGLYAGDSGSTSSPAATKSQPASNSPKVDNTGTVINITTYLNVRSGAGTSNAIVGKLYNGDKVTIQSESNGWYNIGTGWVSANYIKKAQASTADEDIAQSNASQSSQSSTYGVVSSASMFNSDVTIEQIQNTLNKKYSAAPNIIKSRASRLQKIVDNSNAIITEMHLSNYSDKPVSVTTGFKS